MKRQSYDRKVECYDCHEYVIDLRSHRDVCPKSRKAKSSVTKPVVSHSSEGRHEPDSFSSSSSSSTTEMSISVAGVEKARKTDRKCNTDWYFLIDVSGSMNGSKLNTAKACAKELVAEKLNPHDRLAIISFDSNAYFKLKPRVVEQIIRQQELDGILDRIFARGSTALYDAIFLSFSQLRDKAQETVIIVLTDGMDNSSKKTHKEILGMLQDYPNIALYIVHIDGSSAPILPYNELCKASKRGEYIQIGDAAVIKVVVEQIVTRYYLQVTSS